MNARQKAKKYKRLYEASLETKATYPVQFIAKERNVDRLTFERFYSKDLVERGDSYDLREIVLEDIGSELIKGLDSYIDYSIEFCPELRGQYRVHGEIKVVR